MSVVTSRVPSGLSASRRNMEPFPACNIIFGGRDGGCSAVCAGRLPPEHRAPPRPPATGAVARRVPVALAHGWSRKLGVMGLRGIMLHHAQRRGWCRQLTCHRRRQRCGWCHLPSWCVAEAREGANHHQPRGDFPPGGVQPDRRGGQVPARRLRRNIRVRQRDFHGFDLLQHPMHEGVAQQSGRQRAHRALHGAARFLLIRLPHAACAAVPARVCSARRRC